MSKPEHFTRFETSMRASAEQFIADAHRLESQTPEYWDGFDRGIRLAVDMFAKAVVMNAVAKDRAMVN